MHFNEHSDLVGLHAFLSPSNYHWINYDDEKLDRRYTAQQASVRGTILHNWAHETIRLGIRQAKSPKTLHLYVNDAIGYRMTPEQVLFYSENAFGTADTISFNRGKLRIHDLKTGVTPSSVHQLEVYAALFCLEYKFKPFDISTELRIYQQDEVQVFDADPDIIFHIMDKIVTFDKRINAIRLEVMS